jgi:O-antigen/teichoic acid export membrane protein
MNRAWIRYLPAFIRNKIEGRDSLQKVLGNTGWMMGDQIVRKVVGLLVGVLIARYFGPQLYGEFSYALAVVMIVSPLAMLALDDISIRRLAKDPSCKNEVLGTSFIMMVAGGVVAFGLAMAAIFLARPEDRLVQWLVGILAAGAIIQAFIAIEFWFESQMQWKFTVYAKTPPFYAEHCQDRLILLQAPLVAFAWAGLAETSGLSGAVARLSDRGDILKWRSAGPWLDHCCGTVGPWSFPPY